MQQVNGTVAGNSNGQAAQTETVADGGERDKPKTSPGWVGDPAPEPSVTPQSEDNEGPSPDAEDGSPNGATRPSPAYQNESSKP